MKKSKISKITVVSAFVAGNLFVSCIFAQVNLITGFTPSLSGPGGNLTTPGFGPGSYSNGTLTSSSSAASHGVAGFTNNISMINGNSYTFTFSTTAQILSSPPPQSNNRTQIGGIQVSKNTPFTFTGQTGSYQLWLAYSDSTNSVNSFTITNLSLVDNTQPAQVVSSSPTIDLVPNAYALRSVYNIQSAALNAGLSYDCNVFDKEGLCLSTGGRYSTTNSPQATTTSGLLIGSYKYDKNVRLGAWVDQNLSTQNADGIKLSNNAPLFGVFGVWAERNDGLGYEVKVSAGYGDKDVTVTRTSTNEGSSKINSRGLQTVSSYGIALDSNWIAAPYVGVKYVSLKRGAYAEAGSDGLAYDNLRQESTSVIAGVKLTGKIDPKTFTVLSAGVEQDLNNNVGQYSAGSSNTTAFNLNVQKTRPVVTAGVFYDVDKTQRVGLNAIHRQEAFQSTASTTALATYTVGF